LKGIFNLMETSEKTNSEKRKFKRIPVSFAMLYAVRLPIVVRLITGGREHSAVAQDIGEGGLALLANFEIPIDALLAVKFTLTNDSILDSVARTRNFELDVQVHYCSFVEKETYRLGVSFINIVPSESLFIANYIRANALNPNSGI
jgi:hypothetical protein